MEKRFTLTKEEKLKSKISIEKLFTDGDSFAVAPIRVVYKKNENEGVNQVAFSVSKKNFKLAVDRNRIKRLMRESYRLNKYSLTASGYHIMFIYTRRKMKSFFSMESSMKVILNSIEKK